MQRSILSFLIFVAMPAAADPSVSSSRLEAPSGITAIRGIVVDQTGQGLPNIQVSDNTESTFTDAQGEFLISYVPIGHSVLRLDGRHGGPGFNVDYGYNEVPVQAVAGRTTRLHYKSWLVPIDHAHDVEVPSPTVTQTVISSPALPNLQLILAPGVVIRDASGHTVTKISLTAVPSSKLPFPLPLSAQPQVTFSIQPGGACLYTASGGIGSAQILYPNNFHQLPRARIGLLRLEPDRNGWAQYGTGTVDESGARVIPDKSAYITDFGSAECDATTRSHIQVLRRMSP